MLVRGTGQVRAVAPGCTGAGNGIGGRFRLNILTFRYNSGRVQSVPCINAADVEPSCSSLAHVG
jgi:hypothetical protein